MRAYVESLWVRPCRQCGVDVIRLPDDVDAGVVRLEPSPVIGVDAMHQVGPARVAWGWSFTGRYWRVHRFADDPLAYAFLEHSCLGSSLTEGDSMTAADPFGTAAPPGASGPAMADLEGKLILVHVHGIERGITTSSGVSDAARVDVVDLTSGEQHTDTLLWGKVLINQLTAGVKYVGFIGKGTAQPGKSAPWVWVDGSEADKAVAVKYLTYAASQSVATAATPAPAATPVSTPAAPAAAAPPWAQ